MASQQQNNSSLPETITPRPARPVNKQRLLSLQQLKTEISTLLRQISNHELSSEEAMDSLLANEAKGDQLLRLFEGLYVLNDEDLRRLAAGLLIELTHENSVNQLTIRSRFKGLKVLKGIMSLNRMPLQLKTAFAMRPTEYEALLISIQQQQKDGKRFWTYPELKNKITNSTTEDQTADSAHRQKLEENLDFAESSEPNLKDLYPDPLHTFFGLFSSYTSSISPTSYQSPHTSILPQSARKQKIVAQKVAANLPQTMINRPIAAHGQSRRKGDSSPNRDIIMTNSPQTISPDLRFECMFRSNTAAGGGKESVMRSSGLKRFLANSRSKEYQNSNTPSVSLYTKMKEELERPSFLVEFEQSMYPPYSSFHSKKHSRVLENAMKGRAARKQSLQVAQEKLGELMEEIKTKRTAVKEQRIFRNKKKSIAQNTIGSAAEDDLRKHINHVYLKGTAKARKLVVPEEGGRKHSVSPMSSARKDTSRKSYDRKLVTPLMINLTRRSPEEKTEVLAPQSSQTQIRKKSVYQNGRHISAPPKRGQTAQTRSPRLEMVNKCWHNKRELERFDRRKEMKNVKLPQIKSPAGEEKSSA